LGSASFIHHNCFLFRQWCSNLDGSAGFTTQVFDYLKAKVNQGEEIIVSLVVDEMDIRKHLSFDGNKFVGNVDLGDSRETGNDDILKLCEISERKIVETTIYNKLYSNKNLLEYLCIKILVCCTTQYPNILQSTNHLPSPKYN